jgi:hypothetical protein
MSKAEAIRVGLRGVALALPAAGFRPDPAGVAHAPWRVMPWDALPRGPRALGPNAAASLALSQSFVERLELSDVLDDPGAAAAPYAPLALSGYLEERSPRSGIPVVAC